MIHYSGLYPERIVRNWIILYGFVPLLISWRTEFLRTLRAVRNMATVVKTKQGTWRALVRRNGKYASQTFRLKSLTNEWAGLCCKFCIGRRKSRFGYAVRRQLPERRIAQQAMGWDCRNICLAACASFEPSRYRQALLSRLRMPRSRAWA